MSLDHIIESFTVVWFSIRSTFITDVRACYTIKYVRMYVHEQGLCQSLSVMYTCEHSHLHPVLVWLAPFLLALVNFVKPS